ncbi:MAG TPA: heme ABC exporter ATP-binding protein CcmA [Vicinamibacterales bacterium]|nr:heme ABC exporter ATP-binding protein CcmA [Vicinamibacterales bacterium]
MSFDRLVFFDVSRHFERRRALSHVSFACHAGEVVGLLGHNGAGKSTLLSIAATLLRPSAGEVRYGDVTADTDGAAIRRHIGLLGHEAQLYPELSAAENLTFFARLQHLDDVPSRVRDALDRAGLADRADDLVSGFSRGMRQRLALERTLLHSPRLLLLDEPFTGLDQASTAALAARLGDLAKSGCIILLATHDLLLAERLVTRAVVLTNGRLAASVDDPTTLRAAYGRAHAEPA